MKDHIKKIHILHMNDLHSHFENMPKLTTYIKLQQEKASKNGELVIVVDLGDHMDRMRIETEGTIGEINVALLNQMGVSVATVGNNEGLTFTKEQLKQVYKDRKFNIVACNLLDNETNQAPEWAIPYFIEDYAGIKIAWLGATAPYETFYRLQGWDIMEPLSLLKENIKKVKDQADIIILLSHLGIKMDTILAESMEQLDAILGAHTHRFFENGIKEPGQPLICQVGIFGHYIGHLTIEFDTQQKKVIHINEETVNVEDYQDDQALITSIEKFREEAIKNLSKQEAWLEEDLKIAVDKESPLGNLLADGVKNWVGADIGLINAGQILENLEAGKVTKKRIHEICPSPINPCKLTLKGSLIKEALESSLQDEIIYLQPKGYGFRGKELGTLCISGIEVNYNIDNIYGKRITKIMVNDKPLEEDKEYLVGTLDMFTFGGGYTMIKQGTNIQYFLPEFIRDILAVQLKDQKAIIQSHKQRWFNH